jgi:hypothetical protein
VTVASQPCPLERWFDEHVVKALARSFSVVAVGAVVEDLEIHHALGIVRAHSGEALIWLESARDVHHHDVSA